LAPSISGSLCDKDFSSFLWICDPLSLSAAPNVYATDLPQPGGHPNSIRVLTFTNEKFGRLKAEDLVDDRIARKLEREGLF